nr:MAG: hypothetical protein H1Rhizo25958_000002 [Mitovirus sp.]QDH90293.1 MAG: hypothetical protein H1Rhizo26FD4106_000001 [Mitovirus sp.]
MIVRKLPPGFAPMTFTGQRNHIYMVSFTDPIRRITPEGVTSHFWLSVFKRGQPLLQADLW